jgi:hypothetical protein
MKNAFDTKVIALSKSPFTKTIRPIRFMNKTEISKYGHTFQVGNVTYILGPGEQIPILFMGACQVNDWIICLEKSLVADTRPMICGFYKGAEHCNFGPTTTDNLLKEFFEFFEEKILK